MKSKKHTSRRNLNLYNNSMDSQSSTANVKIVYPEDIELLELSEHHDSITLTQKINEVIVMLNRLKSSL